MLRSYRILTALTLVLFLASAVSALAEEIIFQPNTEVGKDARVCSGSPSVAYGTQDYLYFGGNLLGGEQRLYIEFDLSTLDPATTVSDVQLELFMFSQNGWMDYNYSVMQVLGPWVEETLTWDNQAAFDPVAVTSFSGSSWQGAVNSWHSITGLGTLVQFWIANPAQNFGLFIKPTSDFYGYPMIWSSDSSNTTLRPRLVISGNLVPGEELSWGGVKLLFR